MHLHPKHPPPPPYLLRCINLYLLGEAQPLAFRFVTRFIFISINIGRPILQAVTVHLEFESFSFEVFFVTENMKAHDS